MATSDPFTEAYREGMTDSLEGTAADDRARAVPRTLPGEAVALGGLVITPDRARKGWVTIEGGIITRIGTQKPKNAMTIETDGVILPGLLDLHGHPEFNVFAPWEPPKNYVNRYSWRGSKPYHDLVRDPQNQLLPKVPRGTQLRYAEIRALVGGVTAIQGASLLVQKGSHESMVRNVDGMVFGEHRARAVIDLPSGLGARARGGPEFKKVTDAIRDGEVDAFYIHLAEGMRDNLRSQEEFGHLDDVLKGVTKATVIIHGTALTKDQLGAAADAGSRLVWSPQSNLRLYGETTRAGDALDVGLPIALGADWLPSGSLSLLAEMKVARQELVNQEHPVCASTPADVELVMIGGDVAYGRRDWVETLAADAADPDLEPVVAWGRRMLLDTSFEVTPGGDPTPRLSSIRQALTSVYPPVGPIWA